MRRSGSHLRMRHSDGRSGNSNNSINTVYWLKLTNGINASGSAVIQMGFMPKNINNFANSSSDLGEAPPAQSFIRTIR